MLIVLYTATIFVGAFLLFLVEPMVAKVILPVLGGSPSVWNACMVFFQTALLAGYAYAHGLVRLRRPRAWAALHAIVLLVPLLILSRAIPLDPGRPPLENPVPWLLLLLATTVGPFFVLLAATGPLIQRWFAATDHPRAKDPYFLYAASNAGSFLALLAYPVVVEPNLTLSGQAHLFAGGYIAYACLMLGCSALLLRRGARAIAPIAAAPIAPVSNRTRLLWIALAFVPSSLLLGATQYISTDVAAVPLLWVVPLAIYLLSFVLAFSNRQVLGLTAASTALPLVVLVLVGTMFFEAKSYMPLLIAIHLVVLLLASFVCHRRLALSRPAASRLTEFYLLIALGGALGGIFNAIVAPQLFNSIAEYPIALVLACLLRPRGGPVKARAGPDPRAMRLIGIAAMILPAGLLGIVLAIATVPDQPLNLMSIRPWVIVSLGACALLLNRPLRFAGALALLLLVVAVRPDPVGRLLYAERTFFGVLQVHEDYTGARIALRHGTTGHGLQFTDERWRYVPTMYYNPRSPIGDVFRVRTGTPGFDRCAIVGLGAGTLAAYGKPGMDFTFYEIDPAVARIAADTRLFHYLSDSPAHIGIVLGDARLSIRDAPDSAYDLIVLDAFSSDAIPVHLLTKEAIGLYLSKLAPGGLLAFHVTSRYLDLRPVLGAAARDLGLDAIARINDKFEDQELALGATVSIWVVLARRPEDLAPLPAEPGWAPLRSDPSFRAWTDDYSNILGVFGLIPR